MSISRTSAPSAARRVDRVEGEAGGVRALLARDDRRADARRPEAQLLDRRGAERVAGRQRDFQAVGGEFRRELADRRRLARAVDPDDQNDERLLGGIDDQRPRDGRKNALDFGGENGPHFARLDRLVVAAASDRLANARGGGEAKIGLDQHVLEIVERSGVELALGKNIDNALADRSRGPRQAGFQARKPAPLDRRGISSGAELSGGEAGASGSPRANSRRNNPGLAFSAPSS